MRRLLCIFSACLVLLISSIALNLSALSLDSVIKINSSNTFIQSDFYESDREFGIAGNFHIVAFDSVTTKAHANGNILANKLNYTSNFGTKDVNEVSYVKEISTSGSTAISASYGHTTDKDSLLVVGKKVAVSLYDTNYFQLNSSKLDNPSNLGQDDTADYIDLDAVKSEVISIANGYRILADKGVEINKSDMNLQSITITNQGTKNVYNWDWSNPFSTTTPIRMKGFDKTQLSSLIINVDMNGRGNNFVIPESRVFYTDGSMASVGEITSWEKGHVVWNIYDSSKADNMYTGNVEVNCATNASILTPNATITIKANINGTLIGNVVMVEGESHRNDFRKPKTEITVSFKTTKVWVNTPAPRPTIKLQLYQNDIKYGEAIDLVDGTTSHTWNNLPKVDQNNQPYRYTVKEETALTGYTQTSNTDGSIITNTNNERTRFTVNKTWVGGSNYPDITVQLYRNGVAYLDAVVLSNGVTSHTWDDLMLYDDSGAAYTYTADEISVPAGYSKRINVDGSEITNTFTTEYTEFSVEKRWVGTSSNFPEIQIQLYQNDVAYGSVITLKDGATTYTWNNLPKVDSQINAYRYRADEVSVPTGYTKTINADGSVITNTLIPLKTQFSVEKRWVGTTSNFPEIQIQLYQNDVAYGSPIILSNGQTTYTWDNLPKVDSQNIAYQYRADEIRVPQDYIKTINADGSIITNTYTPELTEFGVEKHWVGIGTNFTEIQVQLYQNGVAYGSPITLKDGVTTYNWNNLPKYDDQHREYTYSADELNVPQGYAKTINADGSIITNTFIPEYTLFRVEKRWVGSSEDFPEIQVQLYQNGVAYGSPITLSQGQTTYTWNNLVKYDSLYQAYTYTADEVDIPQGYTKTTNADGSIITNTYTPQFTNFKVEKRWVGTENSTFPEIQIQLYQNDVAYGLPITLKDGATTYTWSELPLVDTENNAYVYRADEIDVPEGYHKTLTDDGKIIVNSRIPELPFTGVGFDTLLNISFVLTSLGLILVMITRTYKKKTSKD